MIKLLIFILTSGYAQNLMSTHIRKMDGKKKGVYLSESVMHGGKRGVLGSITGIRSSFDKSNNYERLVFDFNSKELPYVYAYLKDEKLFIDFFDLTIPKNFKNIGGGYLIKDIVFYALNKQHLSSEVTFKGKVKYDIFMLSNPSRLVIDIKK